MYTGDQWHVHILCNFLKKNCGATNTPVLGFCLCLVWISKPEWAALFTLGTGVCVTHSLKFTSGATPADLLGPAWQPSQSLPHICKQALVRLKTSTYHAADKCSTD